MTKLYIDIETIPAQQQWVKDEIAETITAPGNYKKQESIDKWMEENKESAVDAEWRKTSFIGGVGEIICIAWAVDDGKPEVVSRTLGMSEGAMLELFFEKIAHLSKTDPIWIGHYITGFDLRFLWQRCVIHGVNALVKIPYDAKPWDASVFDTKIEWSGAKSTGYGSLDAVCKSMGFEGKGDIDGSMVWDYVKDGRVEEVAEYCKDDVEKARMIYKRMNFQ
jgi:predicted PolB exonuclease-like 3'-5' exonuclease